MVILLVRHGLAGKPDPRAWPDDDLRPLTPKGRRRFALAARGILAAGPAPEAILSSPALRALQTAEILARAAGLGRRAVVPVPALHHAASPRQVLAAVRRLGLPPAFALVGHEPNLGRLASLLVSGGLRAALPLGKGAACLLEADSASPGAGRLAWSLTQDLLRTLARA